MAEFPQILDGEDKSSPFKNRLRKNYRHVRKWAKRCDCNCFRIYDREVQDYPLAIDYYDGRYCIHYFASAKLSEEQELAQRNEVKEALDSLLGAEREQLFWRERVKREKTQQYEKSERRGTPFLVREHGALFEVDLESYLDTGLFLDHRSTRQLVAARCGGKRLLNLFAYTCAFSVHAARAGAAFTKSVDLSNTYTAWGRRNFEHNGLPAGRNEVVRDDCQTFLKHAAKRQERYDIIVVDPPTLSRSKKLSSMFDVQLDHVLLLRSALKLLLPGGTLFFSTNSRKFRFEAEAFEELAVREISKQTLPIDFYDPKIHRCWTLSKPA